MDKDELNAWYRATLGDKIEALTRAVAELAGGASGAQAELRIQAHKLRGSAASFGFPQITDAAGFLEDSPDEELDAAGRKLLEVMHAAAAEPPT